MASSVIPTGTIIYSILASKKNRGRSFREGTPALIQPQYSLCFGAIMSEEEGNVAAEDNGNIFGRGRPQLKYLLRRVFKTLRKGRTCSHTSCVSPADLL